MKATARAPANIAFIKYWGKKNEALRIPMNDSISMNLDTAFTETSVEFGADLKEDLVTIDGQRVKGKEKKRVVEHLNRIRRLAKLSLKAEVVSTNNFPKGAGIASSASGFAALTVAGAAASGLKLTGKQISILARLGSGSACRSIPDGFVEWKTGDKSEASYAHSLYPPGYWDIADVIVIVGEKAKKVSSTEGHTLAESSPFFKTRIQGMKRKVTEIKKALEKRDFTKFGEILEAEAINMHAVMMTSKPALYYWTPETMRVIVAVIDWRDKGLEAYFTIDAGPNVHVICLGKDTARFSRKLRQLEGVKNVIVNHPGVGARILEEIVLVDRNDKILGFKEKYEAHKNPVPLHRAISVVIFDKDKKRLLIQKRALSKSTWPGFWTNTCCSHPLAAESYKSAAQRRLKEEMGFFVPLKEIFRFTYEARYNEVWGEHEYDVVLKGVYDGLVNPNPEEVADYKWIKLTDLKADITRNPGKYTPWFKLILERL